MSSPPAVVEPLGRAGSRPLGRARRGGLALVARLDLGVLFGVFAFGLLYEAHFLFRGWFPWDEGALADSASRVLAGQLPHRDFAEIYTGGLSYVHGLAFLVFGEQLSSMRLVLFAVFAAWIPALYVIARRFAPPPVAGACVLACIAWSVPNYSASMPSWYNLFLATFAVASLFRYFDNRRARWLVVAGLTCGLSILVKSTGIYSVVGLFLALLFDEQVRAERDTGAERRSYSGFVFACAAVSVAFLVVLLHRRLGAAEVANFLIPGSCIAGILIWNEARVPRAQASARFRSLLVPVSSLGLGLALPLVLFVTPYVLSNSLGSLVDGLLVEPSARLRFAAMKPPTITSLPVTVLFLIVFGSLGYAVSRTRLGKRLAAAGLLAIWLVLIRMPDGSAITWRFVRDGALLLVPIGILFLAAGIRRSAPDSLRRIRTFALLALFAFATLVQFPFSGPVYFCYVAPLIFLASLAVATQSPREGQALLSPLAVGASFLFLAAVGVTGLNQQFVGGRASVGEGVSLGLARSGSLRVSAADSRLYRHLVKRIRGAGASSFIYAGPDAPELYFLADRQSPTRAAFDFFERAPTHDVDLLQALDRHDVSLVALNLRPTFSPSLDSRLRRALAARYPRHERIGRFELRWRP